jgi:7,8-dihydro-6-hydroxymethylpterin dimethyltransferase
VGLSGVYLQFDGTKDRITIPELLRAMEDQSGGVVHVEDFQPKGSENSYCSFHATYVIQVDGLLKPVKRKQADAGCCSKPEYAYNLSDSSGNAIYRPGN